LKFKANLIISVNQPLLRPVDANCYPKFLNELIIISVSTKMLTFL